MAEKPDQYTKQGQNKKSTAGLTDLRDLVWSRQGLHYHKTYSVFYSAVKGTKAIFRALLIAPVSSRWCLAQLPDILRGMIFPLSVIYPLSFLTSL